MKNQFSIYFCSIPNKAFAEYNSFVIRQQSTMEEWKKNGNFKNGMIYFANPSIFYVYHIHFIKRKTRKLLLEARIEWEIVVR